MQVLIVEDDPSMRRLLKRAIEEEGDRAYVAATGTEGYSVASSHDFDVIVLDVMLPGMDGFTLARKLRAQGRQTPILILTAKDTQQDEVHGLNLGADDYLTKPFSLEVLLARLRAVARRGPVAQPVRLHLEDLTLDTAARTAERGSRRLSLTPTEFALLEALMRGRGSVVPREALLEAVWGFGCEVESNTLDAFIRLLRTKVDAPPGPKLIQTVRGVGYALRFEEQS